MSHDHNVIIFDTTLRDGEQTPGCVMTQRGRIQIAKALDALSVDVMEVGFPAADPHIQQSISQIAKIVHNARVAGLARAKRTDIDKAAEALSPARAFRIHTFISTSPVHMAHKLQMHPDAVVEAIRDCVSYARTKTDDVQWSAEDATRSDIDFLARCVETAIHAGATTINLPDTVGYALPHTYERMFDQIRIKVPSSHRAVFSAHCHDDLGLAAANSIAALDGGARQIECTINGIGERAGNAALEEVVMALRVHEGTLPYRVPRIISEHFCAVSKLVEQKTGIRVAPNKAIIGANAFAHESGIHQDGTIKNTTTYEIMSPETVGAKRRISIGMQSGGAGIAQAARDMGYAVPPEQTGMLAGLFKDACGRHPRISRQTLLERCIKGMQPPVKRIG